MRVDGAVAVVEQDVRGDRRAWRGAQRAGGRDGRHDDELRARGGRDGACARERVHGVRDGEAGSAEPGAEGGVRELGKELLRRPLHCGDWRGGDSDGRGRRGARGDEVGATLDGEGGIQLGTGAARTAVLNGNARQRRLVGTAGLARRREHRVRASTRFTRGRVDRERGRERRRKSDELGDVLRDPCDLLGDVVVKERGNGCLAHGLGKFGRRLDEKHGGALGLVCGRTHEVRLFSGRLLVVRHRWR